LEKKKYPTGFWGVTGGKGKNSGRSGQGDMRKPRHRKKRGGPEGSFQRYQKKRTATEEGKVEMIVDTAAKVVGQDREWTTKVGGNVETEKKGTAQVERKVGRRKERGESRKKNTAKNYLKSGDNKEDSLHKNKKETPKRGTTGGGR